MTQLRLSIARVNCSESAFEVNAALRAKNKTEASTRLTKVKSKT